MSRPRLMKNRGEKIKKPAHREPPSKRLHVFWSGRVQGVGFRYTTESVALELDLKGWVRNLPDGRVEAVCEGPEKSLKVFLDKIATGPMQPHIRQTTVDWEEVVGEFDDFRVRFY